MKDKGIRDIAESAHTDALKLNALLSMTYNAFQNEDSLIFVRNGYSLSAMTFRKN